MWWKLTYVILFLFSSACASGPRTIGMQDFDQDNQARGEAYLVDALTVRTPMPVSESEWKPIPFYFKHCTEIGEASYYSLTSYECTYPY